MAWQTEISLKTRARDFKGVMTRYGIVVVEFARNEARALRQLIDIDATWRTGGRIDGDLDDATVVFEVVHFKTKIGQHWGD